MALLSFPNPVNEKAARVVAALVVFSTAIVLLTQWTPLLWLIALGFLLRVLAGPRLSPFGLLATRIIAPRFGAPKLVAGPPKRFAQTIGFVVSTGSALAFTLDAALLGTVFAAILIIAASLEAFVGFCLGCWIFGGLQRLGLIPASVCEACANVQAGVRNPATVAD